jgi:hypothetical protein
MEKTILNVTYDPDNLSDPGGNVEMLFSAEFYKLSHWEQLHVMTRLIDTIQPKFDALLNKQPAT